MKRLNCYVFLYCLAGFFIPVVTGIAQNAAKAEKPSGVFSAGAAVSNITPKIGVSMNGGFQDQLATHIHDDLHARCIVLDDGKTRLAIVVTDLCMVTREIVDEAKRRTSAITNIPMENMMVSATHTHSAGTAGEVFHSVPDKSYVDFLIERIADAVVRANNNLAPARIGWGVGSEPSQVFNRRWLMKPGTPITNPFGTVDQAVMNPGIGNPNLLEPAGPTDPEVPVISIQTRDGRPLAVLANYSLHYVGGGRGGEVSADYYGMFANKMKDMLGAGHQDPPFVAMMSNGTSGDINNINFRTAHSPLPPYGRMELVANLLASETYKVLQNIQYHDWISLDAEQKDIALEVRRPSSKELKRAKDIMAKAKGPGMKTRDEVYARETVLIADYPEKVPVMLQAFRIGDLAITAIPCEVFVEIGLELKQKSPFKPTFNIELANGYNGYLPTPAHHKLGGYETWRARSSYLEVNASDKITETLFGLLNDLHGSQKDRYQLSSVEKAEGFKVLFDGTDLSSWTGNTKDYIVEEGNLVIYPDRGGKGDLFTKEEFDDFVFRFEFQLTPGANNGLGIRAPMTGTAAYEGIELQILDNDAEIYKKLEPYQYHGSIYGVMPAQRGYLKPTGEWNYQEVHVKGNQIKVTLNGHVILDGDITDAIKNGTLDQKQHPGLSRRSGHIGFLGHGTVVRFRNIRVKELSAGKQAAGN